MTANLKLAALLVTLTGTSLATAEALPKPIADLERFVGTWKGTGSVAMGKDKAKIEMTWACKQASAKFGVTCTFRVTGIPGMAVYEETDLLGYEPNTETYHWFSVTNAGETHDHVAKVAKAGGVDKLQFVYTGMQEGKPLKEVIDLSFAKDGKSLEGRAETFVANASASVLELKARK
jgi:hypothetical protein